MSIRLGEDQRQEDKLVHIQCRCPINRWTPVTDGSFQLRRLLKETDLLYGSCHDCIRVQRGCVPHTPEPLSRPRRQIPILLRSDEERKEILLTGRHDPDVWCFTIVKEWLLHEEEERVGL